MGELRLPGWPEHPAPEPPSPGQPGACRQGGRPCLPLKALPATRGQVLEAERPHPDSNETKGWASDGGRKAADLAVLALLQLDGKP